MGDITETANRHKCAYESASARSHRRRSTAVTTVQTPMASLESNSNVSANMLHALWTECEVQPGSRCGRDAAKKLKGKRAPPECRYSRGRAAAHSTRLFAR